MTVGLALSLRFQEQKLLIVLQRTQSKQPLKGVGVGWGRYGEYGEYGYRTKFHYTKMRRDRNYRAK